jgi:hypothetical protein
MPLQSMHGIFWHMEWTVSENDEIHDNYPSFFKIVLYCIDKKRHFNFTPQQSPKYEEIRKSSAKTLHCCEQLKDV